MLNKKIALVTGVGSGIGLATVKKFLKEGACVVGIAEQPPKELLGDGFTFLPCHVVQEAEIEAVRDAVAQQFGKLDCLITICDRAYPGGVADLTGPLFEAASKHICMAPMLLTRAFSDLLHKAQDGVIVHDLSVSALMMERDCLSASLNTAMVSFVRQSTPQMRPVRVNGALFGRIRGHLMTAEQAAAFETEKAMASIPVGRLGTPEDVANLNAFLVSDKARYLNSNIMQVDGGLYTKDARSMGSAI